MNIKSIALASLASAAVMLTACGGGSDSPEVVDPPVQPVPPQTTLTGVFIDGVVANIDYATETHSGQTNDQGEYDYEPGETVTFSIGDLVFPPVLASGVITPLQIAGTADAQDDRVVNMLRLLQTLDQNGNPEDGITITEAAKAAATAVDFDQPVADFAADSAVTSLIANAGQDQAVTALVSVDAALAHFESALEGAGLRPLASVGLWKLTARPDVAIGDSEASYLVLMLDGTYYQIEIGEVNEGSGYEFGRYSVADGVYSFTASVDTNNDAGTDGAALQFSVQGDVMSFPSPDEGEQGNYEFTRVDVDSDGIAGAWLLGEENVLAIFTNNGTYLAVQPEGEAGMELGRYTYDAMNSLLTIDIRFDQGASLLADEEVQVQHTVSVVDGGLFFDLGPDDSVTLTRLNLGNSDFDETASNTPELPPLPANAETLLVGLWTLTNDMRPEVHESESQHTYLALLSDGTYHQLDAADSLDGDGFEVGTWALQNGELSFQATTDSNTNLGLDGLSLAIAFEGDNAFYFYSPNLAEQGTYTLNRVALASTGIAGFWQPESNADRILFVFADDGTYVAFQPLQEEGAGQEGFEVGTYTFTDNTLSVTKQYDLGGSLLLDETNEAQVAATVAGDELTFDFGEGDVFTLHRR